MVNVFVLWLIFSQTLSYFEPSELIKLELLLDLEIGVLFSIQYINSPFEGKDGPQTIQNAIIIYYEFFKIQLKPIQKALQKLQYLINMNNRYLILLKSLFHFEKLKVCGSICIFLNQILRVLIIKQKIQGVSSSQSQQQSQFYFQYGDEQQDLHLPSLQIQYPYSQCLHQNDITNQYLSFALLHIINTFQDNILKQFIFKTIPILLSHRQCQQI
ncbi:unnamed protein product [Paramecium sonneborni]|uniref:Transmembrane protein n=1 Tax=Paramecium sonneborni TaxID=65129 RepID=A0A8S1M0U5_9CILI|nr:unnamed protein product [Paramecium sonneborni]